MRIAKCVEDCFRSRIRPAIAVDLCRPMYPGITARDIADQYRTLRSIYQAAADAQKRDEAESIRQHAARETRLKKACTNPSYAVIESSDGDGVPRVEYAVKLAPSVPGAADWVIGSLAENVITEGHDDTPRPSLRKGLHGGIVDMPIKAAPRTKSL